VFFVPGSAGGVGRSVGAASHLDDFEMRFRKNSPVETNTANPNVGSAYQRDVMSFSLVNLGVNEGLNLFETAPASIKITVQGTLERSRPTLATDAVPSRTRLRAKAGKEPPGD
jgi:hypothetical protein